VSDALPPVCILAGGRATRLGEHARTIPKALVEVAGRPFAFHQLELLAGHGARRIVYCVGHLGEQVEAAVGDGAAIGLEITYAYDGEPPLGTAGAVRAALGRLGDEFLVLYGDTYLRIAYAALAPARRAGGWPGLLAVLHNENRWGPSNCAFDGERVTAHDKRAPTPDMEWIDYGVAALTASALDAPGEDLSDVYAALARAGRLGGYVAPERFYEIGTPERLAETSAFLLNEARAARRATRPRA
jgi:NDP-sugar pyrophosphorylase family protein